MTTRLFAGAILVVLNGAIGVADVQRIIGDSEHLPTRHIDQTILVGDADPVLWKKVLAVLPTPPKRIQVLDLDSLTTSARQRLRGLDGFVLSGQTTIVVIRQGATLRQAEFGDAVDWLILASLIWHEMAHLDGLDERAALTAEQDLWHRFISTGHVSHDVGMTYIARLREASSGASAQSPGDDFVNKRPLRDKMN